MSPLRRPSAVILALALLLAACTRDGVLAGEAASGGDCPAIDLDDYADTSSRVRLTMSGPVVAREANRPVRIIVDAGTRALHILEGYDDEDVAERMRWENDLAAYQEFLAALEFEGFSRCRTVPEGVDPDGDGVCPKNHRMAVELYEIGSDEPVMRLWWADCNRGLGTLAGKAQTIEELFKAQIPEFDSLTAGVEL